MYAHSEPDACNTRREVDKCADESYFKLFSEIMDVMSSGLKRKRIIQIVTSANFKRQHLGGTIKYILFYILFYSTERHTQVLEQHMLPSRWRLFQRCPCLFQQDNVKTHACSPDLPPRWKCVVHYEANKFDHRDHRLLSTSSYISGKTKKEFHFQN